MTQTDERAGAGVEIGAAIIASIDGLTAEMGHARRHRNELRQKVWALEIPQIPVPATGSGVGTVDFPTLLGPRTGQAWSIRRISTTGWTTGAVSVFLDDPNGTLVALFSAGPGVQTFGKGVLTVLAGSRLVVVGAVTGGGVTKAAIAIAGVQMDAHLLADYLL